MTIFDMMLTKKVMGLIRKENRRKETKEKRFSEQGIH